MRIKKGIVKSTKMQNTIIVSVETRTQHSKYLKMFSKHKSFYADTNGLDVREGDTVTIQECKPMSKLKRWKLIEVHS